MNIFSGIKKELIVELKATKMMLLEMPCGQCLNESHKSLMNGIPKNISINYELINDSGIYNMECANGHKSKGILDNINFEMLFDYGLNALVDGYYREAVSSFTSSMERYFEFFIKVILTSSGNIFNAVDQVWALISSQSERQIGSYITMYFQKFLEPPLLLSPNTHIKFRNKVIHKGYIPNRQEAIEYGDVILLIIETSLERLNKEFPVEVLKTFDYYSYKRLAKLHIEKESNASGIPQNFMCKNILNTIDVRTGRLINQKDIRRGNVENQLQRIIKYRQQKNQ